MGNYYVLSILLCILLNIKYCESLLTLEDTRLRNNEYYDIKIFNGYPWQLNPSMESSPIFAWNTSLPIIKIDKPHGTYNPCDSSTFNAGNIKPWLEYATSNFPDDTSYKNGWVAMIESDTTLPSSCAGVTPFHLLYMTYAAFSAHKLGASGLLYTLTRTVDGQGAGAAASYHVSVPPDVSFDDKLIRGENIVIPTLLSERYHMINNKLLDINDVQHQWIIPSLSRILFTNQSNHSVNLQRKYDYNPYTEVFDKLGLYRLIYCFIATLSLGLGIFVIKFTKNVISYYELRTDEASKVALRMRLLILLPESINCFVRIFPCIDPFGIYFVNNVLVARILGNLSNSLSLFTDVSTIIYCYDVYRIFKASRMLNTEKPFISRHKRGLSTILGVVFIMIFVDLVVLYYGLTGRLGGNTVTLPVLFVLGVDLICIILLFTISCIMKTEVQAAQVQITSKDRSAKQNKSNTPGKNSKSIKFSNSTDTNSAKRQLPVANLVHKEESSRLVFVSIDGMYPRKNEAVGEIIEKQSRDHGIEKKGNTGNAGLRKKLPAVVKREPNQIILDKIRKILRLRLYIQFAGFSRIAFIVSLLMFGSNWVYYAPLNYGVGVLLLLASSLFTSLFQILAARQLPSKQKKSANGISKKIAPT